jgi:hypothetical protein
MRLSGSLSRKQCWGSVTFWYGSGSEDPYLWLTDPDPARPSRWQLNKSFFYLVFLYYFLKLHLHHFSKIKVIKKSQNIRNEGFSYYFLLEERRSGAGAVPGTNGSGSGRAKKFESYGSGSPTLPGRNFMFWTTGVLSEDLDFYGGLWRITLKVMIQILLL